MAPDEMIEVDPIECAPPVVAGVPRRFGVGVLMILVTFFAVLFAFLRTFDYGPEVCAVVGVLFVGVAAGQSLLFGGNKPREASVLAGAVLVPLVLLGLHIYFEAANQPGPGWLPDDPVGGLFCSIPTGALLGYMAGGLTASIFLVMDRWNHGVVQAPQSAIELRPLAEQDIDTLLAWVDSPRLLQLWAGPTFSHPLDRPQLEAHLSRTSGKQPELLAFKAVCPDTGRSVGYVELHGIDRARQSAILNRALVGPAETQRGELSSALLRAILDVAFDRLELYRVEVAVLLSDWQAIGCYKQLGFFSERVRHAAFHLDCRYGDLQILSMLRHERHWRRR